MTKCEVEMFRDDTAMKAMATILGHPDLNIMDVLYKPEGHSLLAKSCYSIADAMIEARKQESE